MPLEQRTEGMVTLDDLVEIRTGFQLPKGAAPLAGEDWDPAAARYITPSSFRADRLTLNDHVDRVVPTDKQMKVHGLVPLDLLMVYRGEENSVFVLPPYGEDWEPTLGSGQFLRLRLKGIDVDDISDAYYLAWVLNHPETAQRLAALKSGATVPFISKKALEGFQVPYPRSKVRERVGTAYEAHMKWRERAAAEADAMDTWAQSSTMHAVREDLRGTGENGDV